MHTAQLKAVTMKFKINISPVSKEMECWCRCSFDSGFIAGQCDVAFILYR